MLADYRGAAAQKCEILARPRALYALPFDLAGDDDAARDQAGAGFCGGAVLHAGGFQQHHGL